jgi:hypothetical protein
MAVAYPDATFYGLDAINSFPTAHPHNVAFVQANLLEQLSFPPNHFSFVFQRSLETAFTSLQWPTILESLLRITEPGGWIELIETCASSEFSI